MIFPVNQNALDDCLRQVERTMLEKAKKQTEFYQFDFEHDKPLNDCDIQAMEEEATFASASFSPKHFPNS